MTIFYFLNVLDYKDLTIIKDCEGIFISLQNGGSLPYTASSIRVECFPENKFEFDLLYLGSFVGKKYAEAEKAIQRLKPSLQIEDESNLSDNKAYIKFRGTYLIEEDVELLERKIKSIFGI